MKMSIAKKGRILSEKTKDKMKGHASLKKGKTYEMLYGKDKAEALKLIARLAKKGIKRPKEECEKISRGLMGRKVSKETKEKLRLSNIGQKRSEETCEKISKSLKGRPGHNKGKKFSDEWKRRLSKSHKGLPSPQKGKHLSDRTKRILSEKNLGKRLSEATKEKIGAAFRGIKLSNEHRRKVSEATKRSWKNPEVVERKRLAFNLHPNKPETFIFSLLEKLYPGEWKYTGDFSFMIGGKNPDFVNCNGQKKCIEHYGTYWHKGDDPRDRINLFRSYGYDTLVIWEHELKDFKKLRRKIFNFAEGIS